MMLHQFQASLKPLPTQSLKLVKLALMASTTSKTLKLR
jgi:hypothetical protein